MSKASFTKNFNGDRINFRQEKYFENFFSGIKTNFISIKTKTTQLSTFAIFFYVELF